MYLIDEYFDEVCLYYLHHYRWTVSGETCNAGKIMADSFVPGILSFIPMLKSFIAHQFSIRQTRRLCYLFSVAPKGFEIKGVLKDIQPPSREGFPATHQLLEEGFLGMLGAMESVFSHQAYLFGNTFSLADASVYGTLRSCVAHDVKTKEVIMEKAPATFAWLRRVQQELQMAPKETEPFQLNSNLTPLLQEIHKVFIPLMKQNEGAFVSCWKESSFNEKAFDAGRCLYTGELFGHNFRTVIKTFQVKVWQKLKSEWKKLDQQQQDSIAKIMPTCYNDFVEKW